MAIKTLPFQPERLEPTGISPNTALALPEKRVKWINFIMPSKETQVKSMREIGHAEIGGAVTKVPLFRRAIAKAECKEEFWDLWGKENEETVANFFIVRVLLIGFTSEEQMAYDERAHGYHDRTGRPGEGPSLPTSRGSKTPTPRACGSCAVVTYPWITLLRPCPSRRTTAHLTLRRKEVHTSADA